MSVMLHMKNSELNTGLILARVFTENLNKNEQSPVYV